MSNLRLANLSLGGLDYALSYWRCLDCSLRLFSGGLRRFGAFCFNVGNNLISCYILHGRWLLSLVLSGFRRLRMFNSWLSR